MLFFSREINATDAAAKASNDFEFFERSNVVSHSTYESRRCLLGIVYGRRRDPCIPSSAALARHSQIKAGVNACHYRINGYPSSRNDGKLLVFQSGNSIRAGKHTHIDAVRSMFRFNQWARRTASSPHVWHVAIDHPNMVLSGKLKTPPSSHFKSHWRCNYSVKFPGVAVKASSTCTPEVYPKSGSFIMPGATNAESVVAAVEAVSDAVSS